MVATDSEDIDVILRRGSLAGEREDVLRNGSREEKLDSKNGRSKKETVLACPTE